MYQRLRDAGCRHHEALEKLALKLGLDKGTVARTLEKAEKANGTPKRSSRWTAQNFGHA
jgi:hypothetical protein